MKVLNKAASCFLTMSLIGFGWYYLINEISPYHFQAPETEPIADKPDSKVEEPEPETEPKVDQDTGKKPPPKIVDSKKKFRIFKRRSSN